MFTEWDAAILAGIRDLLYDIRSELRQIKEELKRSNSNER